MNIGLYFGSFNPIHVGHCIIASHILQHCAVDNIWFVVSPHNPLKESSTLLNENNRFHLVQLAIEQEPKFKASNIEFNLPRPSYTIDTMTYISEKYPQHQFKIILGGDSFQNIKKWKNYEVLLQQYGLIVYQRPGFEINPSLGCDVEVVQAPMLDISSTYIRQLIRQQKSIRYLVHEDVLQEINSNRYYK